MAVVIAIVFAVLLYRLAVAGAIYRVVSGVAGGPSVSDIVVSISGACIQLVFIIIMNKLYEYLATLLNSWGEWKMVGGRVHRRWTGGTRARAFPFILYPDFIIGVWFAMMVGGWVGGWKSGWMAVYL